MTNHLIHSKSPYLLQHAHNPVNWYEWSTEAFEKAKLENKPVFVSIGYSTCHWCHVMAHESFEDPETAEILNNHYIAIKVDREERPDIDAIYMRVCQALTGHGGWPLSVFLTPEQKPFYAGMYFPKTRQYNQPSFQDVLFSLNEQYQKNPEKIFSIGKKIVDSLSSESVNSLPVQPSIHEQTAGQFAQSFDRLYGGFGSEPKFPSPHQMLYLLNYHHFYENDEALEMVMTTLDGIITGGIHDHIGGGFCRYSVDRKWLIPHFEKMLYDQAMLMRIFTEAYKITKRTSYKDAVFGIHRYLERSMVSNEGMYYAAEDADSEGEEGKFYLFNREEIDSVLGQEEAHLFCVAYNITGEAVLNGKYLPNQIGNSIQETAQQCGTSVEELKASLETSKEKLRQYREKRFSLHTDDKLLTGWNMLMVHALAEASIVFDEQEFLNSSRRTMCAVETLMIKGDQLYARHRDGETKYLGYLDDYASMLTAYESLYKATFDFHYLEKMKKWTDLMNEGFWDDNNGGFYLSHHEGERLIFNPKDAYDGRFGLVTVLGLSVLFRMTHYTGDLSYKEKATNLINYFSEDINRDPLAFTALLTSLIQDQDGIKELAVLKSGEDFDQQLRSIQQSFQPNLITVLISEEQTQDSLNPLWNDFQPINGETAYYLCENNACQQPVTDLDIVKEMLDQ